MVDFRDRRYDQPDFAGGDGPFFLTTAGYPEQDDWSQRPVDNDSKKAVHSYYRGQKNTQTWRKANRMAARRTSRGTYPSAAHYGEQYEANLVRVMATRGPELAKRFGEIKPGR